MDKDRLVDMHGDKVIVAVARAGGKRGVGLGGLRGETVDGGDVVFSLALG